MKSQFIAAWVTQQQRAFHQSTRGIMTPEDRQILEDEAEKAMAEVERKAAQKAWSAAVDCLSRHWEDLAPEAVADLERRNPYRAALGLTAGQERETNE